MNNPLFAKTSTINTKLLSELINQAIQSKPDVSFKKELISILKANKLSVENCYILNRANMLAEILYNDHNSSVEIIATVGAAYSSDMLFNEAILLTLAEMNNISDITVNKNKIDPELMLTIHKKLKKSISETNSDKTLYEEERHYAQARVMLITKHKTTVNHFISELSMAYDIAHNT